MRLYFDLEDAEDRLNSFHKIDTLITALQQFRQAMADEAALRRARLGQIESGAAATASETDAPGHQAPAPPGRTQ